MTYCYYFHLTAEDRAAIMMMGATAVSSAKCNVIDGRVLRTLDLVARFEVHPALVSQWKRKLLNNATGGFFGRDGGTTKVPPGIC